MTSRLPSFLLFGSLLFVACADKDGATAGIGSPGNLTGPCENHLCGAGLVCQSELCVFPGNSGNSDDSDPSGNPSTDGGTMGGTEGGTTGDPVTTTNPATTDSSDSTTTTTTASSDATTEPATSTTSTTTNTSNTTNSTTNNTTDTTGGDTGDVMCNPPCAGDQSCVLVGDQPMCLGYCDPLSQADCAADEVCAPVDDGFVCAPDASGDAGFSGDPCEFANACNKGLVCLNGDYVENCNAQACCSAWCDLDLADPCTGTMQCVGWFEQGMELPGLEDLGVCIIP